jgi:hypothetical protein
VVLTESALSDEGHVATVGRRRFRSFKTKLMWLVAVAVSVPALVTSLFLGLQLDRQARTLFANGLVANLETFSLVFHSLEQNLLDGLRRVAADNTLQITLDLEIGAQLKNYIEAQRQVLGITFLGVYDKNSRITARSGSDQSAANQQWRLSQTQSLGDADCVAVRDAEQQIVTCNGIVYLLSVVAILHGQNANL